jgi:hypothetical protein
VSTGVRPTGWFSPSCVLVLFYLYNDYNSEGRPLFTWTIVFRQRISRPFATFHIPIPTASDRFDDRGWVRNATGYLPMPSRSLIAVSACRLFSVSSGHGSPIGFFPCVRVGFIKITIAKVAL